MQIVCWSELSAENWKNKLSAGPFLQLSAGNPADDEAMRKCFFTLVEVDNKPLNGSNFIS